MACTTGNGLHSAVVQGPTMDNPRVDITISESPDTVVLTGLLLGTDGVPAAYARYLVDHGGGPSAAVSPIPMAAFARR